ncbi:hypothetical protein HID58_074111 [Brassica napus]|uniref:Uncharacterized protein n=1 Tax=Brassica napus TaxID=3708 RepID=A0ABQ7YH73_BRANA|nr:hypothetical protein HID58_074111 [Brassica napus]
MCIHIFLGNGSFGTRRYNETHFNENQDFGVLNSVTIPIVEEFKERYNLSMRLLVCGIFEVSFDLLSNLAKFV